MLKKRCEARLTERGNAGLLRGPALIDGRDGKYIIINSQRLVNFASNDYLGLGVSDTVRKKVSRNFLNLGASSSSSRLVSGNYATTERAEKEYARHFGYETAIFFSSGYQANMGILSALFEKKDTLLFDKHIHASAVKGMAASGASFLGYNHNSMAHLRRRLETKKQNTDAVLTESLFSMDGDFLDIQGFRRLKERHGFFSIIDEAHAFGALGEQGRGIARAAADIAVGTLGKAFGFFGAFVLLPGTMREFLFNFSSPLIYSTALPEAHSASALDLLEIIADGDDARSRLSEVSRMMKGALLAAGFTAKGDAHIIALEIGDEALAVKMSRKMLARNIFVVPVRYPTVPLGKAIIRIGMTALHEKGDVDGFVSALKDIWPKRGLRHG